MQQVSTTGDEKFLLTGDTARQQGYADQPRSDVSADRRTDRRGRGSRERRQQRVADRGPPSLDAPRYPPARAPQVIHDMTSYKSNVLTAL